MLDMFKSGSAHESERGEKIKMSFFERRRGSKHLREQSKAARLALFEARRAERKLRYQSAQRSKDIRRFLRSNTETSLDELSNQRVHRRSKDTLASIKYGALFADGICQVEADKQSVMLSFTDISYKDIPDESKKAIHQEVSKIYDSASEDVTIQRLIMNTPLLDDDVGKRSFYDVAAQLTKIDKKDAILYNKIINKKVREGVSNIDRSLHYVLTVKSDNLDQAITKLAEIRSTVEDRLSSVKSRVEVLDGEERLRAFHSILRPFKSFDFCYSKDLDPAKAQTTKDAISPFAFIWAPDGADDMFKADDVYGRVLALKIADGELTDRAFSSIASLPIPLTISDFAYPIDRAKTILKYKTHLASIHDQMIKAEKKAFKSGHQYRPGVETTRTEESIKNALTQQQKAGQRMFGWCGYVYTYAKSAEELNEQTLQIISAAKQNSVEVEPLAQRQPEALNSILPIGKNHLPISRVLTTAQIALPSLFTTAELYHERGPWIAQNKTSNNPIIPDLNNRDFFPSGMIFICGPTGVGKSMTAKNLIRGMSLADPTAQFIFFDRKGEYGPLIKHAGGTIIKPAVGATVHFNPFDLSNAEILRGSNFASQIAFKTDAVIAQAAASAEAGGRKLSEEERSILSRCVGNIYAPAREHFEKHGNLDGVDSPLLEDLFNELAKQPEKIAKRLKLRYERFVTGDVNFYNHPSNADWSSRFIGIDFSETPVDATIFSFINACEAARNLMYANAAKGIKTKLVIEEIQALMEFPAVLEYFSRLINEGRQYGLQIIGLTQIPDAVLEHLKARNIILNSDCLILLKQSIKSKVLWEEYLGLGKAELAYISEGTERGDGLLVALGLGLRIPFKGRFPKNNHLYKLYQTEPENQQSVVAS